MDASQPAPYRVVPALNKPGNLSEWEWRLVLKARLLRSKENTGMLIVKWDGPAMTFWPAHPDGRVLTE